MINDRHVHTTECKCFSWKPVFAGALAAIGFSFLLNLFSVAIGLTAFTANTQGVEALAMGGLVATALGIVVSMFAAGWIAGYLGNRYCGRRHIGALYGFLAWCIALLATVFLAAHLKDYIAFYTHFISGTPMVVINNTAAAVVPAAKNEAQQNAIVISTYIVFVLFFLSAFAASLGGHCGMRHVCKDQSCH